MIISYMKFSLTNLWNYSNRYSYRYLNTQILFGVAKKTQILFGIEIIQIPNMNTTIRSNDSNSNWIPNYLSHPAGHNNNKRCIINDIVMYSHKRTPDIARYTLHLHWHLHLHLYTSWYKQKTENCTPHVYIAWCTFITSYFRR